MIDQEAIVDWEHALISSRRVEGMAVYDVDSKKVGTVHSLMIEKIGGRVAFAVVTFGGFFGRYAHVYPVPWDKLSYDVDLEGYRIDITGEAMRSAPAMKLDETDRPKDWDYDDRVTGYGSTLRWWGL